MTTKMIAPFPNTATQRKAPAPPKRKFTFSVKHYTKGILSGFDTIAARSMNNLAQAIFPYGDIQFLIVDFAGNENEKDLAEFGKDLSSGFNQWTFLTFSRGMQSNRACVLCKKTELKRVQSCLGLDAILNPAKFIKYSGLLFNNLSSPVRMVNEVTIQWEEDVVRNGYNFTDGCGVMSQDLALEWGNGSSCLQIRLPGVKGVLSASPKLPQRTVILRPSMKKLNVCVPNQGGELVPALSLSRFPLAVIGFSKPSSSGALNAQVLVLLLERGIPEHVLVSKDRQYRNAVKFSTIDIRAAFDLLWLLGHGGLFAKLHEALMRRSSRDIKKCWNQLKSVQQSELSKWTKSPLANAGVDKLEPLRRVFLPLKESRRLYGISDTAGVLDQHSCFVQVSDKSKKRTITGRVLVVRNPCYHEGDVLLLNAVEHESLNHLNDVIVFSVQGDRPHADMSSGGDLDGDQFLVIWDQDLVSHIKPFPPFDYRPNHIQNVITLEVENLGLSQPISSKNSSNLKQTLINMLTDPAQSTSKVGLIDSLLLASQKFSMKSDNQTKFSPRRIRDLLTAMFSVGVDSMDLDISQLVNAIQREIYSCQTPEVSSLYKVLEQIKKSSDSCSKFISLIDQEEFCFTFFESSSSEDDFWHSNKLSDTFVPPMVRENIDLTTKALRLLDSFAGQAPICMTSLISSDTLDLIKKFLSAETASICVDAVSRLEESIRAAEPEREHLVALKEKISAATSDELPITEYIREISKHLDQNLVLSDVINRSEGFAFVLESLATALTRKDLESQDLMDLDRLLRVEVGILTSGLPIYSKRKSLSRFAQDDTKACLVLSSTGSGKSTCIPHFLAHDRLFVGEESTTKKILVAQPRRNATTSLATRLAGTLGTAIGTEIGSHIGKSKSKISKHQTMIHCVTYGILLSYAQNDPHFRNYSIIVLDEVHEDSCELHFCIGLIKHAQKHNPTLKVLLMSAQVNAAKFTDFFGQCPVIEVAGQSFPVSEQHVGSLSTDAARFIPGAIEAVMNIHKRSDNHGNPDILVFLPRVNDIVSACSQLRQKMADEIQNGGSLLDCALPLHSFQLHSNVDEAEKQFIIKRLPMASRVLDDTAAEDVINSEEGDELDGLFGYNEDDDEEDYDEDDDEEDENADLDEGNDDELNVAEDHVVKERRVIFCTNIAETSLTFQKVGYVVDAGLQLTISRNPILNTQKLELKPTTTVSAVQRKGRAGRLAPGHCVRLYSPADEENFVDQTFSGSDAMDMMILRIISLVGGDLTSGGFEWFVPPTKEEFEYVLRSLRGQRMISLVEDDNYRLCQAGHCALEFCRMGLSVTATRFLLNIWTRRTPNLESAAMNQAAVVGALLSLDCGNRMFQKGFKVSILFGDSKPTTTTAAAAGGGGGGSTYCKLLVYDKWLSLPSKSKRAKWCKEHFVDNSVMKELHELHSRILKKQKSFIPNHFNQNGSDWNHFGLKSGSMDDAVLENLIAARFQYIGRVSSEGGGIVFWIGDKEMAGVVGRDEFAQFGHNKEAVGWVLINCVFHKDRYYVSHLDPISNEHLKRAHQILHTEFRESFALGNCEKWCVGHDLFQCKEALPESEFRLVNAPKVIKKTSGKQDKENQSVGCTIS